MLFHLDWFGKQNVSPHRRPFALLLLRLSDPLNYLFRRLDRARKIVC